MYVTGHEVRLFADDAFAFHHRIADGFVVNQPAPGSQLGRVLADVFDADVIGEHELPEHRV